MWGAIAYHCFRYHCTPDTCTALLALHGPSRPMTAFIPALVMLQKYFGDGFFTVLVESFQAAVTRAMANLGMPPPARPLRVGDWPIVFLQNVPQQVMMVGHPPWHCMRYTVTAQGHLA